MDPADRLEHLERLRANGSLTEQEFRAAKEALLAEHQTARPDVPTAASPSPEAREREVRQWAMLLHLSQLAGILLPVAGVLVPILLWQMKRAQYPELDVHGKIVANWLISYTIYMTASIVGLLVLVGFALVPVLGVLGIVFTVIGAMKANEGIAWPYPLSIRFV
jgi:hypothetical protein